MISIERMILNSVLENGFLQSDDRIIKHTLDDKLFNTASHKLFVKAINRLKELKEPVCSDTMMVRLQKANRWTLELDNELLEIISSNPCGTYGTFIKYYEFLKNHGIEESKLMEALNV